MGDMIEFASNGGSCSGYLAVPDSGRGPGVVVIQEWWGLVPHIKSVCDRLAADGFVALAADLYHGETAREPDAAAKIMMELRLDQAGRDMRGAAAHLLGHEATTGHGVGSVGFCMGGGLSLWLATIEPTVTACVAYYGVIPWSDVRPRWGDVQARVLGHFAENDASAGHAAVDPLEATLRDAGKDVTFHWYPGTDHAFFNDDRPEVYDEEAARTSYRRTVDFLRAALT